MRPKQSVMWGAYALFYGTGVNLFAGIVTHSNWAYIFASIVAVPISYMGAHLAHEMHLSDRIGPVDTGKSTEFYDPAAK